MSDPVAATWVGQPGLARCCRVLNKAAIDLSGGGGANYARGNILH